MDNFSVPEITILSRSEPDENGDRKRRAAIEILTKVKECLQEDDCDNDSLSVKDLLVKCTISDEAL
ncbi:hypothetical protein MAR_036007 [Mya arenaria]|uniref:Uncharacterized protein n=1 Tax=Mya arenaria TaxID=6604 RepID=A0ABY7EUQ5_MYAAR|nr:hypothetical protein MAR_036007 [Mya arenaria]